MSTCVPVVVAAAPSAERPGGRSVFPVALAGFVAIGLPEGALGVAWPAIRARFDQPLSGLGLLLAVYTAGYVTTSLLAGALEARLGRSRLLSIAAATGAVGLVATATAAHWPVLVVAGMVVGATGGVLDAVINAHVTLHHGVGRLGLLHAAYGIGATLAPLALAGLLAAGGSWRTAYVALGGLEVVLLVAFGATRAAWTAVPPHDTMVARDGSGRRRLVVLSLLLFFVYVGFETTAGQWSFSLLTEHEGLGAGIAGLWAGSFFATLTVGRLLLGPAMVRWGEVRLLDASLVVMLAGGMLVVWAPVATVTGAGFAVAGLGAAALFPALIAVTPRRLGAARATRLIGYQIAASAAGGAVIPAVTGVLANHAGLNVVGPVLVAATVILIGLHRAAARQPSA